MIFRKKNPWTVIVTILSIVFVINCNADWVPVSYNYPSIYEDSSGFWCDNDVYFRCYRSTYPGAWRASVYAELDNMQYNEEQNFHGPLEIPASISGTFDEVYEWQGSPPPTYDWSWEGTGDFTGYGYAVDTPGQDDEAYGICVAQCNVEVPGNVYAITDCDGEIWVQSKDGQIRYYDTYLPRDTGWTSGQINQEEGICCNSIKRSTTTGIGPYHRKGIIDFLQARAFICGDKTKSHIIATISFYLNQ
ncbi:MAG: hypothetical protein AB1656_00605 [Candidatus Omnitrophota bacterium]